MFLEKEDVSLYYEVRGDGDPLILIHGVMVDAGLFERTAELLSRFYRVVTYDRRGNSRSILRAEQAFSMDDQAADILALMDHLGIGSAYFAGASAGAAVGQHFLSLYPEIGIILDIDADHLDFFKDLADIRRSFHQFASQIHEGGTLILNSDIEHPEEITDGVKAQVVTYGSSPESDYYPTDITYALGAGRAQRLQFHRCRSGGRSVRRGPEDHSCRASPVQGHGTPL